MPSLIYGIVLLAMLCFASHGPTQYEHCLLCTSISADDTTQIPHLIAPIREGGMKELTELFRIHRREVS
jgi:hypothetical protein